MTTDETARAMKMWEDSLPRGKTITPDMAFHAGYEIALAQQNEDVKAVVQCLRDAIDWIKPELVGANAAISAYRKALAPFSPSSERE